MQRFTFGVLTTWFIAVVSVNSQAQQTNPNYDSRTEIVAHANISLLPKKRQDLSIQYQRSVASANKNLLSKNLIPFFPYYNLNLDPKLLPPAPFRVYLGKLSKENIKDYVLIIVPCKENDSLRRYRIKPVYKYLDINSSVPGARWYSVRVDSIRKDQDRITYTQVVLKTAYTYVANFKIFQRNQGLLDRYPTCIVYEGKRTGEKNDTDRLRLQPVIRTQTGRTSSISGGSKSVRGLKKFMFADRYTLQDADERANICCEAPPENGNLMNN